MLSVDTYIIVPTHIQDKPYSERYTISSNNRKEYEMVAQVNVRLDEFCYKRLERLAEKQKRPVASMARILIERTLDEIEPEQQQHYTVEAEGNINGVG